MILFDLIYRITDIQRGKIMIGLITGAGRGLGYELAKKGLELGCEIIGTCRKRNGALQELTTVPNMPEEFIAIVSDATVHT